MFINEDEIDKESVVFSEDKDKECIHCHGTGYLYKPNSIGLCSPCEGTGVRGGKTKAIPNTVWSELLKPTRMELL